MPLDTRLFPTVGDDLLDSPLLELEMRSLLGGQVNKVHGATLEPNQAEIIRNIFANRGCLAERRPGISDVMAGVTPSGAVLGLGWWNPPVSPAAPRLLAAVQSGVYSWDGAGDWELITGISISGTKPVYFAQADTIATGETFDTNLIIMQEGNSSVYQYDGTTTGATVSGGAWGSDSSVPTGTCVISWRGQTWVSTIDGYIRYSEFGLPTRFDVMNAWTMNPTDPPTRIVEWFGAGIICFNRNSVMALEIDQGNFDNLLFDSTRIVTLNYEIGAVSGKSVAQAGQDFFFLSRQGVVTLSKTAQDRSIGLALPISEPIRETIARINWAKAGNAAGAIWDRFYLLAIPVDGSNINNLVIAYDIEGGGWYEITGWNVGDFQILNFPDEDDAIYFGTSNTAGAGEVYLAFDESVDTDDSTAIDAQIVTARIDGGTKEVLKLFQEIAIYTDAQVGGTIEVYAAADNGDFVSLGDAISVTSGGVTFPIEFPVTFPGETLQRDTYPLCSFGHVREMRFKFEMTGEFQTRIISACVRFFPAGRTWS